MDDRKLIEEIRIRRPLWDVSDCNYQNRDMSRTLWDEVAKIMNKSRDDVQKKWKNMRDVYRRELRKQIKSNKKDSGTHKWRLFEHLKFLENIVQFYETTKYVIKPNSDDAGGENVLENEDIYEKRDSLKRKKKKAPLQAETASKREKSGNGCEEHLVQDTDKRQLLEAATISGSAAFRNDDDYNFLISFHPYMVKMPEMQKLYFRVKMQELLYNVMSEVNTNPQYMQMNDSYVISDATDTNTSSVTLDIGAPEASLPPMNFGQYRHLV